MIYIYASYTQTTNNIKQSKTIFIAISATIIALCIMSMIIMILWYNALAIPNDIDKKIMIFTNILLGLILITTAIFLFFSLTNNKNIQSSLNDMNSTETQKQNQQLSEIDTYKKFLEKQIVELFKKLPPEVQVKINLNNGDLFSNYEIVFQAYQELINFSSIVKDNEAWFGIKSNSLGDIMNGIKSILSSIIFYKPFTMSDSSNFQDFIQFIVIISELVAAMNNKTEITHSYIIDFLSSLKNSTQSLQVSLNGISLSNISTYAPINLITTVENEIKKRDQIMNTLRLITNNPNLTTDQAGIFVTELLALQASTRNFLSSLNTTNTYIYMWPNQLQAGLSMLTFITDKLQISPNTIPEFINNLTSIMELKIQPYVSSSSTSSYSHIFNQTLDKYTQDVITIVKQFAEIQKRPENLTTAKEATFDLYKFSPMFSFSDNSILSIANYSSNIARTIQSINWAISKLSYIQEDYTNNPNKDITYLMQTLEVLHTISKQYPCNSSLVPNTLQQKFSGLSNSIPESNLIFLKAMQSMTDVEIPNTNVSNSITFTSKPVNLTKDQIIKLCKYILKGQMIFTYQQNYKRVPLMLFCPYNNSLNNSSLNEGIYFSFMLENNYATEVFLLNYYTKDGNMTLDFAGDYIGSNYKVYSLSSSSYINYNFQVSSFNRSEFNNKIPLFYPFIYFFQNSRVLIRTYVDSNNKVGIVFKWLSDSGLLSQFYISDFIVIDDLNV